LGTISSLFSISFEYISLLITLGGGHRFNYFCTF
jgi:hypothetical protein